MENYSRRVCKSTNKKKSGLKRIQVEEQCSKHVNLVHKIFSITRVKTYCYAHLLEHFGNRHNLYYIVHYLAVSAVISIILDRAGNN